MSDLDIIVPEISSRIPSTWAKLVAPVRSGIPPKYLEKTKVAFESGLLDAGINYIWDLVVNDLRRKIEAYGADIFVSVEDGVKWHSEGDSIIDRWRDVTDYKLLSGCRKLNIISRTAYRHLLFMLNVRNHESAAHPVEEEEEVDGGTAYYFVWDAVRFVLSVELPEPGFHIGSLAQNLKDKDLSGEKEEITDQLTRLTKEQSDSVLGLMVSIFLENRTISMQNVLLLIQVIWDNSSEDAKRRVGEKYARFSAEGESDLKRSLFSLLTHVGGIKFIPQNLRAALFLKASKTLIQAHFEFENFAGEEAPARQLAELGVDCPDSVLFEFCSAYLLSYMGNYYGNSWVAEPYLLGLKDGFNQRHWTGLIEAVRKSDHVQSEMFNRKPYSRLKKLCREMIPLLTNAKDKRDCELIIKGNHAEVFKLPWMREEE